MRIRLARMVGRDDDAAPGIALDVDGETVTADADGYYDIGDRRGWLASYAAAHDIDPGALVVTETCTTVKTDGEVCGRDLPCPYHSNEDD